MRRSTRRAGWRSCLLVTALAGALVLSVVGPSAAATTIDLWGGERSALYCPFTPQDYKCDVAALYQTVLGRRGDPAGINFWAAEVLTGRRSLAAVRQVFATSSEARGRVTGIFRDCLLRGVSPADVDFRVARLASGQSTMYREAVGISRSPEASAKGYPCYINLVEPGV